MLPLLLVLARVHLDMDPQGDELDLQLAKTEYQNCTTGDMDKDQMLVVLAL